MTFVRTSEDDKYRLSIVNLILGEILAKGNQSFATQNGFAAWVRAEKPLLRALFGGQGIQRLARIVAWWHREQVGQRRDPPEVMCYFADIINADEVHMKEPILADQWKSLEDVLRSTFLDSDICSVMMKSMSGTELPSLARTALIILI